MPKENERREPDRDRTLARRSFGRALLAGSVGGGVIAATTRQALAASESLPLLGEIKLFSGNFEPPGWLFCDGRLLPISEHVALFEIVGNTYGGNGRTTFGVPDLRGRVPMGTGAGVGLTNRNLGEEPGRETVILDVTQLPAHDHTLQATNSSATQLQPGGNILARAGIAQYLNATHSVDMGTDSIGSTGSNAPHANVQPSTVLNFIIAIAGRSPRDEVNIFTGVSDATAGASVSAAVTLDRHSGVEFTSGITVYVGLRILEHEDGVGTIWLAIPKNHDLDAGPVTPVVVLAPDVVTPVSPTPSNVPLPSTVTLPERPERLSLEFLWNAIQQLHGAAAGAALTTPAGAPSPAVAASVTLDRHSGLEFTSGITVYLGLEILEHEAGVGTIWLAIPKNHDLETGPVTPVIVLAPDKVTPVAPVAPGVAASVTLDRHSGLEFTSGITVYLGLEILEHEAGVGTIWLAIPKNHDLETGPVTPVIILAPDKVTPVSPVAP